jgi:hypothetical protein
VRAGVPVTGPVEVVGRAAELASDTPHVVDRQPLEQSLSRIVALFGDGHGDAAQRLWLITARNVQLVNEEEQDIELADCPEALRDLAKPAVELLAGLAIEREQR